MPRCADEDEDGTVAATEVEQDEPEAGTSLPEQQEPALRGASSRDAARNAQMDTKKEDGATEAAEMMAVAEGNAAMAEVSTWQTWRSYACA